MKVCQVHGGATPRGIASPHYKTGRYSRSIPARLAGRYEEAKRDAALLELSDEISLIDARLEDLLTRVDSGESGALWRKLMDARAELLIAQRAEDRVGQLTALREILDLIAQGHSDYRAWVEVGSVLEQRRKLVESERKRLVEMQQMITSQQAMVLVGAIVGIIRDNVTDRTQLANISRAIDALAVAEGRD